MSSKTKESILEEVSKRKIKFIRLWFTDILGQLKSFAITPDELKGALEEGMGFDGSSVEGFARIDESDMIAKPDPSTFQLIPWMPSDKPEARMFCDIFNPDGSHYEGDPRYVLRRNLEEIAKKGLTFMVGPEMEYFYFKDSNSPSLLDKGGYFDLTTLDAGTDLRRDTILALQAMGIPVEFSHHEVAPSQHEIDMRYADALTMADNVMTCRIVIKEIAQRYGFYATFMPKPIGGVNGSGMHIHMSLFKNDKNIFFSRNDESHISDTAKYFMAGLLGSIKELTSITNQWVNSYKRLVPGYEAPVYISWAQRNRSTLVRIPMYKPKKEKASRIELRNPDPACNPYLVFSVILAAGMEGIEKKTKLPMPIEKDLYKMSGEEKDRLNIESLPGSLIEAVNLTEKSKLLNKALGEHVFTHFIQNRKIEWDSYCKHVTDYEIDKYLPIL